MSILDLNTGQNRSPRGKKTAKIWLGIGLLVAVLGTGSTLAANITLNGGVATESGQGVQAVVFCGGSSQTVTATPFSAYKNTATTPKFTIAGIKITGIPKACDNTDFIVTAYPAGSDPTPTGALSVSAHGSLRQTTICSRSWNGDQCFLHLLSHFGATNSFFDSSRNGLLGWGHFYFSLCHPGTSTHCESYSSQFTNRISSWNRHLSVFYWSKKHGACRK